MPLTDQTLILCRLIAGRQNGKIEPKDVSRMFQTLALPAPPLIGNIFRTLKSRGHLVPGAIHGEWQVTPAGQMAVAGLLSEIDMAGLIAGASDQGVDFASTRHTLVPPSLAAPDVIHRVGTFLERFPFETNVFGMTRFPDDDEEVSDPVASGLSLSKRVLQDHGLSFHLASDRAISDGLWANVAGHMWASAYGVAFFEDRRGRGLNYNLVMEVGAMLMTGRRCLLLKDSSIMSMPTDLVGHIYKSVDLDDPSTVDRAVHEWVREDLGLGACSSCPTGSIPEAKNHANL